MNLTILKTRFGDKKERTFCSYVASATIKVVPLALLSYFPGSS